MSFGKSYLNFFQDYLPNKKSTIMSFGYLPRRYNLQLRTPGNIKYMLAVIFSCGNGGRLNYHSQYLLPLHS